MRHRDLPEFLGQRHDDRSSASRGRRHGVPL